MIKKRFVLRKGKIYPLFRKEREVREFIQEQIRKGYIQLLKSPQIVLVFFVKKKRIKRREWYKMISILISEQSRITIQYHLYQISLRILELRRYLQSWI